MIPKDHEGVVEPEDRQQALKEYREEHGNLPAFNFYTIMEMNDRALVIAKKRIEEDK